jgi:hypothetical protein
LHAIAHGVNPTEAYTSEGYSKNGAAASINRILKRVPVRARLHEIRAEIASAVTNRITSGEIQTGLEVIIANKHQQVRLKGQRYVDLMQIKSERASFFTDPNNAYVVQLGGLKNMPGVTTGYVVLNFKTVAGRAMPHLELDTALIREMASLEEQVGRMMGFVDPITALQIGDTNNLNIVVMQCDADRNGQD